MVGHLCVNFLSLLHHILFLMPLFDTAWGSLDTVHTWTSLYKVWTYVVQNIRSFFKLRISRFKVDVPSITHCPFRNTILDYHVLSVQNAIIPPVTFSNYYFFDYLIFSINKRKMKIGRLKIFCRLQLGVLVMKIHVHSWAKQSAHENDKRLYTVIRVCIWNLRKRTV